MKIPKGFAESLSIEALAEGVFRCHANAIRLATAAELLLDNGLYASRINSCRLAVEELAKSHLLISVERLYLSSLESATNPRLDRPSAFL
jgi:AbiV family abortive infection protein